MNKPFLLLAVLLFLAGCSVKEDRRECPCILSVVTSDALGYPGLSGNGDWTLDIAGYCDGEIVASERLCAESRPDTLEYPVRKGTVLLTGILTYGASVRAAEEKITIIPGNQADSLYACSYEIDAGSETAFIKLVPHKQFSTIILIDTTTTGTPFGGREVVVRGNFCGHDLRTGGAVPGPFLFRPSPVDVSFGQCYMFRIPRQGDSSLEMDLISPTRSTQDLLTVELGKMMFEGGYDSGAADLPDMTVAFTPAGIVATISIEPWSGFSIDINI